MGLANALRGVALAVHALCVRGRNVPYLSWSQLDEDNIIMNQTQRAGWLVRLLAQRLHLQALRVDRQVLHLFVASHLLQRCQIRTFHLQVEFDGVFVCKVSTITAIVARRRKLLEIVGVGFDGDETESVAQYFILMHLDGGEWQTCITEVLSFMKTVLIAIDGTSAINTLRIAFAIDASTPTSSKTTCSSDWEMRNELGKQYLRKNVHLHVFVKIVEEMLHSVIGLNHLQ